MRWYEDPEYWVMCEKAEKIQALRKEGWDWQLGNFFLHKGHNPPLILLVTQENLNYGDMRCSCCKGKRIYLPSQEDLQEMVSSDLRIKLFDSNPALMSLKLFYDRISQNKYFWQFKTYSKLWLAFVYHELYQKKWNPEKKKWEEIK